MTLFWMVVSQELMLTNYNKKNILHDHNNGKFEIYLFNGYVN